MLEQKWLENHEIYYIGAAELPYEFTYGAPLPKGDRDTYVACFEGNEDPAQQCFKNKWTLKACVNNEGLLTFLSKRL